MSALSQSTPFGAKGGLAVKQKSTAIWWWAAVGLFCIGLQASIFWQWYANGDMHPTNPGITPLPGWMGVALKANDAFWTILILATLYFYIVKPWFKTRQLTFDAIFILAFITIMWQDPLYSFANLTLTYNSHSINLGSWACHIPGWITPGGCNIAEPLTIDFAYYFILCTVPVFAACRVMHRIKSKYPNLRTSTMFIGFAVLVALIDAVFEPSFIALGVWQYGGVPNDMSVFADSRFKFPLFEPVFVAFSFVGYAAMYYFRNDKGETLAERGLDQVNVSAAVKQWLRFLALSGAANASIGLLFTVPIILFNTQADAWPKAIQEISWYTNGICGEGTAYACGGKNIPIPRTGQGVVSIGPNGELIVPPGVVMPQAVPHKRTAEGI